MSELPWRVGSLVAPKLSEAPMTPTPDPAEVLRQMAKSFTLLGPERSRERQACEAGADAIAALAAADAHAQEQARELEKAADEAGTMAGAYQLAKRRADAADAHIKELEHELEALKHDPDAAAKVRAGEAGKCEGCGTMTESFYHTADDVALCHDCYQATPPGRG